MRSLKAAARRALDVLHELRKADAGNSIVDPEVVDAIEQLEAALLYSQGHDRRLGLERRLERPRPNAWGFAPLESLYVKKGRHEGQSGRFIGVATSTSIYLATAKGRAIVDARYVERLES